MHEDAVYYFKRTRHQRSYILIAMGTMCLVYIAGLHEFESLTGKALPEDTRVIGTWAFSISAVILYLIAIWLRRNPATFEAILTKDRLTIKYPNSERWSFDVAVDDIKRFEYRQSLSHAGQGIAQHGVLLNDGAFHHISMNYGLHIGKLHKALQKIRPDIRFPNRVNQRVEGFLNKDYDD